MPSKSGGLNFSNATFFDSKFPTLANYDYPHVITTVIRNEHEIEEFPENFRKNSMFKYLFKGYGNKEYSKYS